jgi:hypothetical protein
LFCCLIIAGVPDLRFCTFKEGFPLLINRRSKANSSIPKETEHLCVTVTEKLLDTEFGLVSEDFFRRFENTTTAIGPVDVDKRGALTLQYSTEHDIAHHIQSLLTVVAKLLGLELHVTSELNVFQVRADLWILTILGVPVGAVEVKKPGKRRIGVMSHQRVLGELYDQMLQLSNFYGKLLSIGILITGEDVRVAWCAADGSDGGDAISSAEPLIEPSESAATDGVSPPSSPDRVGSFSAARTFPESKTNPIVHSLTDMSAAADSAGGDAHVAEPETAATALSSSERHMFITPIVRCDDGTNTAMRLIMAAMMKMARTKTKLLAHPFENLASRKLICFVKESSSVFWSSDLSSLTEKDARWNVLQPLRAMNLYAVEDLGHGDNGRVWLTSTSSGYIHVLKFAKFGHNQDILSAECDWWHKVYPEFERFVAVEKWSNYYALRMPHFAAIREVDRSDFLSSVEATLRERFDDKGFVHSDVKWQNIGQYIDDSGNVQAIVYDLSVHEKDRTGEEDATWVDDAIRYLKETCR